LLEPEDSLREYSAVNSRPGERKESIDDITSRIIRCLPRSPHPVAPPVRDAPLREVRVEDPLGVAVPVGLRALRPHEARVGDQERPYLEGVLAFLAKVQSDESIAREAPIERPRRRNVEPSPGRDRP
jgi:hypothetical protein